MHKAKKQVALLSIMSNATLILLKFIVGLLTGSVSIISEAIHSFTDFLASILAFFSVKASAEPADIKHQYGHGKFEDLSGGLEGLLILIAAGYIIYEAVEKIINNKIEYIDTFWGIVVMLFSVIINIIVSKRLFKVAHETESIALLADAQHLRTDVYTSVGVLVGLILIKLTGITIFDPLVAIFVALLIIKAGYDLCRESLKNLLDESLPPEETITIQSTIEQYIPEKVIKLKHIKTRKAGSKRLVEFILIVPADMTIKEGHALCDNIEADLFLSIKDIDTTIHLEPCDASCSRCTMYYKDSLTCSKLQLKNK